MSAVALCDIQIARSGQEPTTVEFNTNPAPGVNAQSARIDDVSSELKSLDPYPETPESGLALADYRATLLVREG